jgi:hypothetical protein
MKAFKFAFSALIFSFVSSLNAISARAFTIQVDDTGSPVYAWNSGTIVFDVNYTDCLALGVSAADLDSAVDTGVALWNSNAATSLVLARGSQVTKTADQVLTQTTAGNPLIVCDANLGNHVKANSSADPVNTQNIPAVTRVLRVDGGGHIILAAILLNAQVGQSANVKGILGSPGLLPIVVTHEMGHAFGLGHSSDPNALMYYDATSKTTLSLAQDDVDGVNYLYPRHEGINSKIFGCGSLAAAGGSRPGAPRGGSNAHGDTDSGAGTAFEMVLILIVCAIGARSQQRLSHGLSSSIRI